MSTGPHPDHSSPSSAAAPMLGPLEQRVQEILWATRSPVTARQVQAHLTAPHTDRPAYTTVATVLEHLWQKGTANRARVGRSWSYEPSISACEYSALQMATSLRTTADRVRCLSQFLNLLEDQDRQTLMGLMDGSVPAPAPHPRTPLSSTSLSSA